jgi:glycosyltransferase involved in cell wall biosynthesis
MPSEKTRVVAIAGPDDYDAYNPVFTGHYLTKHSNWHFINSFAPVLGRRGISLITYAFSSSREPGLYVVGDGENLVRIVRPSRLALSLMKLGGAWRYFASLINVTKLVKPILEDSPTVILNTHFPHFPRGEALAGLAKLMGKKFGYFQSISLPDKSLYDKVAKIFRALTDIYVFTEAKAATESTQRYLIPPEKVFIVALPPRIDATLPVSTNYNKSLHGKRILFVGRLDDKQKAVSNLIKAFKKVVEQISEAELIIVGDGFDRPILEQLVRQLGLAHKTSFVGWVSEDSELVSLYQSAYVFCLPSRQESYALVVTEAMMAGLPVVCSDLPCLRDRVVDGVTGLMVRVDDVEELSSKLLLLLSDEGYAAKLSENAKQRVREIVKSNYGAFADALTRVMQRN